MLSIAGAGAVRIAAASAPNIIRFASQDVVDLIGEAVAPFSFRVERSREGLALSGDGPAVLIARQTLKRLAAAERPGDPLDAKTARRHIEEAIESALRRELVCRLPGLRHPITPLSLTQIAYLCDLLNPNAPLVLGLGPTATGKTHMAIAAAMSMLANGDVRHVVITKPHEMLENEVATPQVRAELTCDKQFERIYDLLDDLVGVDTVRTLEADRRLEIMPIGAMRGRTFSHSFILLDEAHHATIRRMRMATTRAGLKSRMAIIGDPAHARLRSGEPSGLSHLLTMIRDADIGRIHSFRPRQIIRNETVARLETLYEKEDPALFA